MKIVSLVPLMLVLGAVLGLVQLSNADQIICQQNYFGRSSSAENKATIIPEDFVNDGYCDCLGGEDEYGTSACSGIKLWSGVMVSDGLDAKEIFICPIEGINIPMSRVNDGICDCCDGSDEIIGQNGSHDCPENCKSVLDNRKQLREEKQHIFTEGYQKRLSNMQKFEMFKNSSAAQLSEMRTELEQLENSKQVKSIELEQAQKQEKSEERNALRSQLKDIAYKLGLVTLTINELEDITVSICYLEGSDQSLRQVGHDLFDFEFSSWGDDISSGDFNGRDFDEYDYENDDIYHVDDEEKYFDESLYEEGYEDFDDDFEAEINDKSDRFSFINDELADASFQELKSQISNKRLHFKEIAKEFTTKFDESGEFTQSLRVLKSNLKAIERSEKAAISARMILQRIHNTKSNDWCEDLLIATVMTLSKSKVGAADFYEILHSTLPEFLSTIDDDFTNSSIRECPPQSVHRMFEENQIIFPSKDFALSIDERCRTLVSQKSLLEILDDEELYAQIDDDYSNYYEIIDRLDSDPIVDYFAPLLKIISIESFSKPLQDELSSIDKRIGVLKSEKVSNERTLAGSSEMFAFHGGNCIQMEAGEYRYSICPGGKAAQHKRNSSVGMGTTLGVNHDLEKDSNSQVFVMKFLNGARCWNGPNRSATIFISCGTEHVLLAVIEPETCVYEFTMQSFIACDEDYAKRNDLVIPS